MNLLYEKHKMCFKKTLHYIENCDIVNKNVIEKKVNLKYIVNN